MVYEVKIYRHKWISKSEIKGTVFIHKSYRRWVCISRETFHNKELALREVRLCITMDKEVDSDEFKYSIRVLKKTEVK